MKGRQSIYNYINTLRVRGWIEVVGSDRWRTGGIIESYKLTKLGLYRSILYNPEFEGKAKLFLDFDFKKDKEEKGATSRRNQLAYMQYYLRLIEHMIENGKAPPTWYLTLDMRADDNGVLSCSISEGTEKNDRFVKLARESIYRYNELTKQLLDAGGGRFVIGHLTPKQKTLVKSLTPEQKALLDSFSHQNQTKS